MNDTTNTWAAIVTTLVAGGGGMTAVLKYLRGRESALVRNYIQQQAKNEKRIEALEKAHKLCMDQHIQSERQLGELIGQMREMQRRVGLGGDGAVA